MAKKEKEQAAAERGRDLLDIVRRAQQPTRAEVMRNHALALAAHWNDTVSAVVQRHNEQVEGLWRNPNVRPEEITGTLGPAAASLFHKIEASRAFVRAVAPHREPELMPHPADWDVEENADGSVSITRAE